MSPPLKVLYVDDEPDIREVAVMSLELDPMFQVVSVASGDEALAYLNDRANAPDVILLDVMMPGLDGPSVLERLRDRPWLDKTAVIFITARARESEQVRFVAQGAHAVITKPFDPMTLAQRVRDLLGR